MSSTWRRRASWAARTRSASSTSRALRSICRRARIPYADAGVRQGEGELRATARRRAAHRRTRAVGVLVSAEDGEPRSDGPGRLLLAGRVRARPHQEARADAARQGGRPHAPHRHPAGADRPGVPDLPRVQGHRRRGRSRDGRAAAVRLRGAGRHPPHAVAGRRAPPLDRIVGGLRGAALPVHRRRPPPGGERGADAPRAGGAGRPAAGKRTGCSRWRSPTTRRRSCPTTAW